MNAIIEQVREGLTSKVEGLEMALKYVRDPIEFKRLQKEMDGARAALAKLNEKDTRTKEEVEELANMVDTEVSIETTSDPWGSLSPCGKFKYQVSLYRDKLKQTLDKVVEQEGTLSAVVSHLKTTKGDADFMNPIIKQFENSLAEVQFSKQQIEEQLSLEDSAMELVADEDFYANLSLLNKFLNNPMSLPNLSEERESKLKELRDVQEG